LVVKSVVRCTYRFALPNDGFYLDFPPVAPGRRRELTVKAFTATADKFDLDYKFGGADFEAEKSPLAAGEGVEGAKVASGWRLVVRTADKLDPGYHRDDLTLTIEPAKGEPRTVVLPVYATAANGEFSVTPEQVRFQKPLGVEDERQRVRVQFTVPTDKDAVEVLRVEPAFLKTTPPVKLSNGVWEFQVVLPKDADVPKENRIDEFFEGRVVFKTTAAEGERAVRVKWFPEGK
jgi:hypothetical protein